jgi:GNAT superfamily N-acetyltransferase
MERAQLLALHERQQRIEIEYRLTRREVTPEVVRHVALKHGEEGMVLHSRLNAENADRVIAEQIARYQQDRQNFEWKTYDYDPPDDLKERLSAQGFQAEEPEALLVLDIATAPPALLQPVTHDVRRLTNPQQLEAVRQILESVWNEPFAGLVSFLGDELIDDPDHWRVYVAYAGGVPVSAAWISFHDHNQFAGLWGGATLAPYRGRGCYTALLAARLQEARSRGVRFLTVDASSMSRPILEKSGFQFLTFTQPFKWQVKP